MGYSKKTDCSLPLGAEVSSKKHVYRIMDVLGAGGFGITYKVTKDNSEEIFAMKEYFPDLICERGENNTMQYFKANADNVETGIKDFLTEAKRLNKEGVKHPNIVAIDEVFNANNTAYYTMEYINGETLSQYVKNNKGKPLTLEQTKSVMRPIFQAVVELHKKNITHLDIKHDNILLTFEDDDSLRPVLIDFGQSKHYDKKGRATSQLTNAGCSEGFAPPEQYMGLREFTPQADVYALCATILYLLSGKQPLMSSDMTASKISEMLDPDLPENIKDTLIAGLKSNKNDRIQTVSELAHKLEMDISQHNHEGNVTRLLNLNNSGKKNKYIKDKARQREKNKKDNTTTLLDFEIIKKSKRNDNVKKENKKVIDELKDKKSPIFIHPGTLRKTGLAAFLIAGAVFAITFLNKDKQSIDIDKYSEKASLTQDDSSNFNSAFVEISEIPNEKENISETEKSEASDDDLFIKASQNGDFNTLLSLSNKGYAKAYFPLANIYFKKGDNPTAKNWAQKSIAAKVNVSQANALIAKINVTETTHQTNNPNPGNEEKTSQLNSQKPVMESTNTVNHNSQEVDYGKMAAKAFAAHDYDNANIYAQKAVLSGNTTQKSQGNQVISNLKIIGYFDKKNNN